MRISLPDWVRSLPPFDDVFFGAARRVGWSSKCTGWSSRSATRTFVSNLLMSYRVDMKKVTFLDDSLVTLRQWAHERYF